MDIHESVVRVMNSQQVFGESFYDVFFDRNPEVRTYFAGTDMKRQALLLTMALSLIEEYHSNDYPATGKYIQHLGTQHHGRNIPRELYPKWRDAMLVTLQRFLGDEWTHELAAEWTEAIDLCARIMFEGYSQRHVV